MNHSTIGRPRQITDAQIHAVRSWKARNGQTLREFAAQIGVGLGSARTVRRGHQYKTASTK